MLLLAGSIETHLTTKGAFQELDAVSLLTPHTKVAVRPASIDLIPAHIETAYRTSYFGKPGPTFVDLPGDLLEGSLSTSVFSRLVTLPPPPIPAAHPEAIHRIATLIQTSTSPLVIIGKGAAYAHAESAIRSLINSTHLPFLPTPMGKGVVADSHPCNTSSARSTALLRADVVLVLGARLNWILHYGESPKWNPSARIIQVDISAEELGRNGGDPSLGVVGDVNLVVNQLIQELGPWQYDQNTDFVRQLGQAKQKNEAKALLAALDSKIPMTYHHAFDVIKRTLHSLSPPEGGQLVYVSEGSNTMDISRSIFPLEQPRLRLDAGTYATMGLGLAYAISAHLAYNTLHEGRGGSGRKKIIAFEGDSAFGFSAMEVETMARYGMDVLIFVINNGGIYHGDTDDLADWRRRQRKTIQGQPGGLRSTSLGREVRYEKLAEACGGLGFFVRTPKELETATREAFVADVPCVVNVIIEAGKPPETVMHLPFTRSSLITPVQMFSWQASPKTSRKRAML